ncbi:hypothetical protein [Hymenobacter metallilatus]|uniref:hypothetical protein n=1 Tax=Hymenobacter metallilatus TaxID=2493666 RepID=UPI001C8B19E5|nr:hypothetical protein [Hymenobacter metallilatus]
MLANRPNRLLGRLVGGLLVLNLALVGWLWLAPALAARPQPASPASGAAFLADTLQFSASQRVRYDSLRVRYFRQVTPLAQQCRQSCQQYFSLVDSTLTDAQLAQRSRAALDSKVTVDVLTVRHLQQVAALCTPAQRILLQRLVSQAPGDGCAAPGANAECLMPLSQ